MTGCAKKIAGALLAAAALAAGAWAQESPAASAAAQPPRQALRPAAAAPAVTYEDGVALYEQQRYGEALGVFIRVLAANPGDSRSLEYEGRSIDALFEQREDAALLEGSAILRDAMSALERHKIAVGLAAEGTRRLQQDDPISGEDLFLKALDIARELPEAVAGLTQADALARWQLREGNQERSPSEQYALKFALQGLLQFNAGHYADAAPTLQQSLFLLDPAAPEYPVVSQMILRSKAAATLSAPRAPLATVTETEEVVEPQTAKPAAAPAKPVAAAPAPARIVLPPSPPVAPTPAVVASAPPPARDPSKSGELYLQAVTSYLTGKRDEALDQLSQALTLDPENTRAKKLQDRIRLENAAQAAPAGGAAP